MPFLFQSSADVMMTPRSNACGHNGRLEDIDGGSNGAGGKEGAANTTTSGAGDMGRGGLGLKEDQ